MGSLPEGSRGKKLIDWVAAQVLPLVQKPGRYIGGEMGEKERCLDVQEGSVVLAFPDVYEIGAGHVGLSLLQHSINGIPGFHAERTYCPWPDMERLMRRYRIPLYSLGTYSPCSSFDVFGITIQHELSYTNVLSMIDLAGIPVFQVERGVYDPYVVGGGPGMTNPEPIVPFFDLFVIGDGEGIFPQLVSLLASGRTQGKQRAEVLAEAARIQGVYVPSFYEQEHGEGGEFIGLRPLQPGIPRQIEAAVVESLDPGNYPEASSVPLTAMIQDRHTVEIMRGCPRGCKFCQAKRYYGSVRYRDPESIVDEAVSAVLHSGWDEVSLLGLSCSDYPGLETLLSDLNDKLLPRNTSISLPSLRADSFTEAICKELGRTRRGGLTFAPEAGTEKLRKRIGKSLKDEELLQAIDSALSSGWTGVKLYFMLGLPGEEWDDVEGIVLLSRRVHDLVRKKRAKRLTISCSPFVPKPQTPFEREAFLDSEEIEDRQRYLRSRIRGRGVQFKWRDPEITVWEVVFARGDRKLAQVLLQAWKSGARFDEWESCLRRDLWTEAMASQGLEVKDYLRMRSKNEHLPWSHLSFSARRKQHGDSLFVDRVQERSRPKNSSESLECSPEFRKRMRIEYRRTGLLRFISHLDIIRLWRLILRRARIPLAYSAGFSPRAKMSFGPALPFAMEGKAELLEFWTKDELIGDLVDSLAICLPFGLEILRAKEVTSSSKSLESLVTFVDYAASCRDVPERKLSDDWSTRFAGLESLEWAGSNLRFSLRFGEKGVIKPRALVAEVCGLSEDEALLIPMTRESLWAVYDGNPIPLFEAV